MIEWLEADGKGAARVSTGCATGCSRASATGASRSRSSASSDGTSVRCRPTQLPVALPRSTSTGPPTTASRRWRAPATMADGDAARRARRRARDQHHAAVGGLVLVLPALPRSAQRARAVVAGGRALLDAGRPLRRRRRARGAAPAVCALLAQGAVRLRPRAHHGAVSAAVQPGDDPRLQLPGRDAGSTHHRPTSRSATASRSSRRPATSWSARSRRCRSRSSTSSTPTRSSTQYGADALRLYELFMGPLEQVKPWQMSGVEGVYRFLQRVWRLVVDERSGELSARLTDAPPRVRAGLARALHATIKKVLEDTEALRFNTAIAQMMIFVNEATAAHAAARHRAGVPARPRALRAAPRRGAVGDASAHRADRPRAVAGARSRAVRGRRIELAVQVNGKRRDVDQRAARRRAAAHRAPGAGERRRGAQPRRPRARKVIVVPGRLVNIVV